MHSYKKSLLLPLLLCFLCRSISLFAGIVECSRLEPFEKALEKTDSQTLVLFDVDGTLIFPKDRILQPHNQALVGKFLHAIFSDPSSMPSGGYPEDYLLSRMLAQIKFELVDLRFPAIIHQLQQRRVKAIALTALQTGTFGVIPNMEDWRVAQLKGFGIDFSQAFPKYPEIIFSKKSGPVFKKGVLCSDKSSKGEVLVAFLKKIRWFPKKVIFIDDRRDYLQSVEAALKKHSIKFKGFLYTGASVSALQVDAELGEFQFRHLAKYGEWLSEEEALKHLNR